MPGPTTPDPTTQGPTMQSTQHPDVRIAAPGQAWNPDGGRPTPPVNPALMELTDVSVYYGDYEAVRNTTMPTGRTKSPQ
jgi:phosphate transport system ATP-binding protein